MAEKIEFTSNYNDLSTDRGFQYEFVCDRCGSGVRTTFKPSVTGMASGMMEAASSLFGGLSRPTAPHAVQSLPPAPNFALSADKG